ncbi:MAG: hypothetical protein ACLVAT_07565 [Lachnospiraceae bacterium]
MREKHIPDMQPDGGQCSLRQSMMLTGCGTAVGEQLHLRSEEAQRVQRPMIPAQRDNEGKRYCRRRRNRQKAAGCRTERGIRRYSFLSDRCIRCA